jgi:phospholipid/cholesterol/gamma-HCH transport system ATP-binding protein
MKKKKTDGDFALTVRDVRKRFGDNEVLKGVSLDVRKGENLVVLGKSGTGKSVLIKCIVRLLDADGGSIEVLGNEVNELNTKELNEVRKKIGFLFQSGALYDSMTVRQNLLFPLRRIRKELKAKEMEEKVKEALDNVGLPDAIEKMPSELSGGQKKRISLARTIIVDPEIMLYDEPTTGLDPITSDEISQLINDIQRKYKTASIIITHDIECARTVADRIVMLKDGEIYKEGSLEEFEKDTDGFIRSFFTNKKDHKNHLP